MLLSMKALSGVKMSDVYSFRTDIEKQLFSKNSQ